MRKQSKEPGLTPVEPRRSRGRQRARYRDGPEAEQQRMEATEDDTLGTKKREMNRARRLPDCQEKTVWMNITTARKSPNQFKWDDLP